MKEETKNLMEDFIVSKLDDLNDGRLDDKEAQKAQDIIVDFGKILLENDKIELDAAEKRDKREMEAKDNRIDRYVGYGISIIGISAPLIFSGIWMRRGFEFEKTGTYCSKTFQGLFGQFKLKK